MTYCKGCLNKQQKINELEEQIFSLKAKLCYQERTAKEGFFGSSTPSSKVPVPMTPIVDFNGDGNVDCVDICIMTEYWGTDESLCDIAPTPFGDGIVDIQDLIVLAEHLTKDDPNAPVDPNLVTP